MAAPAPATLVVPAAAPVKAAVADGEYAAALPRPVRQDQGPGQRLLQPEGIPYHSVETLIVEAPDYGHETTSEAYSLLDLARGAVRPGHRGLGAVQQRLGRPWRSTSSRRTADQPTNSFYNPIEPGDVRARSTTSPSSTRRSSSSGVTVGTGPDRRRAEVHLRHRRHLRHALARWTSTTTTASARARQVRGAARPTPARPTSTPSSAARRSRSGRPSRSRPATTFKYGGPNGYLDLFTKDASYAKQWKYTNAPDADARAVEAAYWA